MAKRKTDKMVLFRLQRLAKYLVEAPGRRVRLDWRAVRPHTKLTVVRSYEAAYLDPDTLELSYEGWEENHHNGDPYSEASEKVELTPYVLDDLMVLLRRMATAKALQELKEEWDRRFGDLAEDVVRKVMEGKRASMAIAMTRLFPDQG